MDDTRDAEEQRDDDTRPRGDEESTQAAPTERAETDEESTSATPPPEPDDAPPTPETTTAADAAPPDAAAGENGEGDRADDDPGDDVRRTVSRMTRRSLAVGAGAALLGWGGWQWLWSRPRQGRLPWPLRRVLEANRRLWQAYFSPDRTAPTYPVGRAQAVPVNGDHGLDGELDPAAWRLVLEGASSAGTRELTLHDVLAVGTTEVVTELRCIEGWTRIAHWSGVRLADLLAAYPVPGMDADPPPSYVAFETPDRGYYVGLDLETALHPQTLLAHRLNGEPLTPGHGAPLRLVVPIAYGIKSLKRLGTIRLTATRPADYWAERGYDWYSVH